MEGMVAGIATGEGRRRVCNGERSSQWLLLKKGSQLMVVLVTCEGVGGGKTKGDGGQNGD